MKKIPFRLDIVGSFLRPEKLKKAREDYMSEKISLEELKNIEDNCIRDLIDKQVKVGLQAVTDGEFRRKWWHLDFIAGLNGITTYPITVEAFGSKQEMELSYISGKLSFDKEHKFLSDFVRTKELANGVLVKQTIPGPGMVYLDSYIQAAPYHENPIYKNEEEFKEDLISTYQDAILAFYDVGCRYLQLDDTSWGAFFSKEHRERIKSFGFDPDGLIQSFGDLMEKVVSVKPEDMYITTHMCKGNFKSHWLYEGSYDNIAKRLFKIKEFDGFFFEYDNERSGDFEPLQYLEEQKMVLGLITTKTGELENKEELISRIRKAEEYVPLEQLCLSPQCGFASTEEGNNISEEEQWDKLRLAYDVAREVWGDL